MRKIILVALLAISANVFGQGFNVVPIPNTGKTYVGYTQGMVRIDSIVALSIKDTTTVKAAYPEQRMKGRVAWVGAIPYIHNGVAFVPFGGGGGGTWGSITGTLSEQTDLNTALGLKAPLASPALTGVPTAPTAAGGTNTNQIATTAYVKTEIATAGTNYAAVFAPIASPTFTGTPTAPTPADVTNNTQIPTTAWVKSRIAESEVSTYHIAYVDTLGNDGTAVVGRPDKPFATINAALDACSTFREKTIKLGYGRFAPVTPAKITGYTKFIGETSGEYDFTVTVTSENGYTITTPTRIVRGSVILGGIRAIDVTGLEVHNIGLDNGPAFVDAGGTESDGIATGSAQSGVPLLYTSKCKFINVKTLGSGPSTLWHGIVVQDCFETIIEGCSTWFGTHGIVSKSVGTIIRNNFTHNHDMEGIIIKSDGYSLPRDIIVEGNRIMATLPNCGGIYLQDFWTGLSKVKVINNYIDGTDFGIAQLGTSLDRIEIGGNQINNLTGGGKAIHLTYATNSTVYDNTVVGYEIDVTGGIKVDNNRAGFFTLEGASTSLACVATNNIASAQPSYVYGSFVYGANNFGFGKTGTSLAISDALVPPDVLTDDFDRANNALTMGNTDLPGTAWVNVVGTWGISGNEAYPASNTTTGAFYRDMVKVDAAVSDFTLEVDVELLSAGGGSSGAGIMFRFTDANNFLALDIYGSGLILYKQVAGVGTQIGTTYGTTNTGAPNTFKIVATGGNLEVFKNGVSVISGADAFNASETNIGFYNNSGSPYGGDTRFENLSVY